MFTGLFIDDDERDFKYAGNMSIPGKLEMLVLRPDRSFVDIADEIYHCKPDILALDFRLDEILFENSPNRYKAGPLAQLLRDHATDSPTDDIPIVLVSHEQKVRDFYNPDLTSHDLFDCIYEKENLGTPFFKSEILSLILGYKKIINCFKSGSRLLDLLCLDSADSVRLHYQHILNISEFKAPHQISRYVHKNIIRRNGPLLDEPSLFAALGIAPDSTGTASLKAFLAENGIRYQGVFSEGWERWWEYRLVELGVKIAGVAFADLTGEERVAALNSVCASNLRPAKSRWTNSSESFFAFACASCLMPTEIDFSVEAYDPIPYDFMPKQRICWKCIQTGEYKENKLQVGANDRFIADRIENGIITQEVNK